MSGDFPFLSGSTESPLTLGYEFSGVVDALDLEDIDSPLCLGDKVCGISWDLEPFSECQRVSPIGGAFAEYILFAIPKLCLVPGGVSMKEAAAVGIVGLTASQLLKDCGALSSHSRLLILGGSSAVGSVAIQLAKLTGAWVATTASSRSLQYVSQFGPDLVVNYNECSWDQLDDLKNLDAVIDTIGEPDAFYRSVSHKVVGGSGVFSSTVVPSPYPSPDDLHQMIQCKFKNDKDQYQHLLQLLTNRKLKIPIDQAFSFSDEGVRTLIRYQQRKKSLGKNLILFGELATYHGSCSCGGVTFKVSGRPEASLICHCRGCQQLLAGLFASLALYPRISITSGHDLLVSYGSPLALNRCHFFCRVCGKCLYLRHPNTESFAVLMMALEDFPFHPSSHIHYDQRKCSFSDQLPKYSGWLERKEGLKELIPKALS